MNYPSIFPVLALAFLTVVSPLDAQTVTAGHTIRSKTIIALTDLVLLKKNTPGAFNDMKQVVGMETRTVLYPGRPIRLSDIGRPAVIERNQISTLIYAKGAIFITAEGRALDRGGIGDRIRAMNLSSRKTIIGVVTAPGIIEVTP